MPDLPAPEPQAALPPPGPPAPSPEAPDDRGLLLRILYDEQTRLRQEIDELRQKQEQQPGKDQKKEGGDEQQDQDKEGGEKKEGEDNKEEGDKKEGEDKKEGGDKKEGEDEGEGEEKDKQKQPSFRQRAIAWVRAHPLATAGIVFGIIILIIASILLWRYLSSYETTDDAFVDGHTDPISPRISGFVTAIYVEDTYPVKKGQLLVELDARDYQVAKERAAAQLAQAQADVRAQSPNVPITQTTQSSQVVNADQAVVSAAANFEAAGDRYRSALADLRQAEANESNASREEQRYRKLVEKEEVSQELYDQRLTEQRAQAAIVQSRRDAADSAAKTAAAAQASLRQAQQQAMETRANLPRQLAVQRETTATRVASAQAALASANQAELNLEYTRIYAPEDGIIGNKQVQLADQVQPGQELFALTQTNDIWVTANFKETEIQHMQRGQSVTIYVDALKQKFDGYVEYLPGATGAVYSLLPPENATGNYVKVVQRLPVRIRFKPNQPNANRLAPGMSVEPKVWIR